VRSANSCTQLRPIGPSPNWATLIFLLIYTHPAYKFL